MSSRLLRPGFAILGMAIFGCGAGTPKVVLPPPPPVTVSKAIVAEVVDRDEYEGRIAAEKKVEVRARVRGHLTKVKFKDGQMVKAGDSLYEIDPRPYKATLDGAVALEKSADASLKLAQAENNRYRALAAKGAASREEAEVFAAKQATAKGDLLKAQASAEQARLDFEFTNVTAPIDGMIGRTQVDLGNLVNAMGETVLTTIVSVDPMYVYFNVDERSLQRYRQSHRNKNGEPTSGVPVREQKIPVFVAIEGEKGFPHQGVIDFVDNKVNPSTATQLARGMLGNKKRDLDDGMRARVSIPVSDPYKAIMVIERAIGTEQGRKYVYVVNDKNLVERRDVTLGRVIDGLQVVQDGLKAGELVIVNGIARVRDGIEVKPHETPMPGEKKAADTTQPAATK